ncbi:MAG: hypothetical protein RhofKO_08430 [Rhodothermales bacterium]
MTFRDTLRMRRDKLGWGHYIYDGGRAVTGINFIIISRERDLAMKHRRFYTICSAAIFSLFALAGTAAAQADYEAFASVEGTYRVPTQGQLKAVAQGASVRLEADGQEAIDWLVGADAKTQARHRRFNNLAVSVVSEMIQGDDAVQKRILAAPERSGDLERLFSAYTDALGTPEYFEVIGTTPREDESHQTYVRMVFAERTTHLRLSWHGSKLNTIARSPAPTFEAMCMPSEDVLSCTMNEAQTITVRRDDFGAVTQLVQTSKGTPVAYRTMTPRLARQ